MNIYRILGGNILSSRYRMIVSLIVGNGITLIGWLGGGGANTHAP